MRISTTLLALGPLLLAHSPLLGAEPDSPATVVEPITPKIWPAPGGGPAEVPPRAETAKPARSYDQLFGEILQNLPQSSRAKVDSARMKGEAPSILTSPDAIRRTDTDREARRDKALDKLDPELKARVEKAIRGLDDKRKERDLEFKELGK